MSLNLFLDKIRNDPRHQVLIAGKSNGVRAYIQEDVKIGFST